MAGRAWAQPPADCAPNALNIPNAPSPCVFPDGRAMFRVVAPDAQKVTIRLGRGFEMTKGPDGFWYATTTPQVVGFHYYTLSIDGKLLPILHHAQANGPRKPQIWDVDDCSDKLVLKSRYVID
jgi:enterochelin esterase family protein